MKRCQGEAEARVEWLLQLESSPFSLNTHYLSDYRVKFLAYYKAAREKYETSDLIKHIDSHNSSAAQQLGTRYPTTPGIQHTGIAKVLSGLSEIGLSGIKAEDLANLLPPDRMAPALEIMAEVRAYFQGEIVSPICLHHPLTFSTISCLQTFHGYGTPCDRSRGRAWCREGHSPVVVFESWD